jgi:hypothetical protein
MLLVLGGALEAGSLYLAGESDRKKYSFLSRSFKKGIVYRKKTIAMHTNLACRSKNASP